MQEGKYDVGDSWTFEDAVVEDPGGKGPNFGCSLKPAKTTSLHVHTCISILRVRLSLLGNLQNLIALNPRSRMASGADAEYVLLDTNMGRIIVELYTDHAPRACRNFATLASKNYYNGVTFHRIIKDFMIQGGDPTGTGRGGSSIYGEKPLDDPHPLLKHSGAGILSMANSGPKTEGSQFFITLAPTPWLDGKHIIFGRVKSGMSIVKRIGLVETDESDRPRTEVQIREARVLEGGNEVEGEAEDGV